MKLRWKLEVVSLDEPNILDVEDPDQRFKRLTREFDESKYFLDAERKRLQLAEDEVSAHRVAVDNAEHMHAEARRELEQALKDRAL